MDAFRKPVPLLALMMLLGVSYYFLLIQMYGWSWVWSPQPEWWREFIDRRRVRAILWLQLCHTLGVILIALPVATVVACVVPARRVLVGTAIGFAAALALIVPDLWFSPARGVALVGLRNPIVLFDYAKQMLAVPVLVWLLLRLAARNPRRGK
jgi:ABC-type spermidine/putrescine transport system permease subunit II